jgi:predicted RNase H-like nuclease (RuvC/YqgF family)
MFCILTYHEYVYLDGKKIEADTLTLIHTEKKTITLTTPTMYFAVVFEPASEIQDDVVLKQELDNYVVRAKQFVQASEARSKASRERIKAYQKGTAESEARIKAYQKDTAETKERIKDMKANIEANKQRCIEYDKSFAEATRIQERNQRYEDADEVCRLALESGDKELQIHCLQEIEKLFTKEEMLQ